MSPLDRQRGDNPVHGACCRAGVWSEGIGIWEVLVCSACKRSWLDPTIHKVVKPKEGACAH